MAETSPCCTCVVNSLIPRNYRFKITAPQRLRSSPMFVTKKKWLVSLAVIAAAAALGACSKEVASPAPESAASAPAPAAETSPPKSENSYNFKIGELSAVALSDGHLEFPNDNKIFGLGHSQEEVNALLTAANLPTDKLQLGLEPLLVKTSDRVLLFDTGS